MGSNGFDKDFNEQYFLRPVPRYTIYQDDVSDVSEDLKTEADAPTERMHQIMSEYVAKNEAYIAQMDAKSKFHRPKFVSKLEVIPEVDETEEQLASFQSYPISAAFKESQSVEYPAVVQDFVEQSFVEYDLIDPVLESLIYWDKPLLTAMVISLMCSAFVFTKSVSLWSIGAGFAFVGCMALLAFRLKCAVMGGKVDQHFKPRSVFMCSVFAFRMFSQLKVIGDQLEEFSNSVADAVSNGDLIYLSKFLAINWLLFVVGTYVDGSTMLMIGMLAAFTVPAIKRNYGVEFTPPLVAM